MNVLQIVENRTSEAAHASLEWAFHKSIDDETVLRRRMRVHPLGTLPVGKSKANGPSNSAKQHK